jgi:hypothetical protein
VASSDGRIDPAATVAAQWRARLEMARQSLHAFPDDHVELFQDWLRMLPVAQDGSTLDPVRSLGAALLSDLDRVRWDADVSTDALIEPLLEFCQDWGADPDGLALLGSVGEQLDPAALGTWVESRADGFDLGWSIEGRFTYGELAALLPLPDGLADPDAVVIRRVARSLAPDVPTTRLRIELPVGDQTSQVEAASDLLSQLDAPLPGDGALGVYLNLAEGDVGLTLWTLDDGIVATGLTAWTPSTELVVALAHELGRTDELDTIAAFGALLLVDAPTELELRVRASGDEFELAYSVPAEAPDDSDTDSSD